MSSEIRWYHFACQVNRAPSEVLECAHMSKQERCSLRKIAQLHPEIGRLVDELEAPWNVVRQIAHAKGAAAQWDRAQQVLGQLVERRAATAPRRALRQRRRIEEIVRATAPTATHKAALYGSV